MTIQEGARVDTVLRKGFAWTSRGALGAGALGALAQLSGVALTATAGWLIVRASERPIILTLLVAIVAVRAFGMARPAFRYVERLVSHDVGLAELAAQRTRVFAGLIPLTPARLARRSRTAMLTSVVDDLDDATAIQPRVTVPLVATGLTGIATVALTLLVDVRVGAIVAGLLVVAAAAFWVAVGFERTSQRELGQARAEVNRVAELVAGQAGALQAIGAQREATQWLTAAHGELQSAVTRQSRGRALAAGVMPVATAVATALVAVVVAGGGHAPAISALLVLVPFALADVLGTLPDAARALARATDAGRRVDQLLDLAPAVGAGGDGRLTVTATPPRLRLSGVTASWDGARQALPPTDIDIAPGAVQVIAGASGSGKSTLLAVLARNLDPVDGTYTIDGQDVTELRTDDARGLFAIVDDEPHVFASSVRENLRLAQPDATDHACADALVDAGLADWLAGLPDGLDTRLGAGGRGISGGERARLAIARALLSGRPVLLLDEPVAHLDHPTAVAVLGDLIRARAGRTVVVVSHSEDGLAERDGMMVMQERWGG